MFLVMPVNLTCNGKSHISALGRPATVVAMPQSPDAVVRFVASQMNASDLFPPMNIDDRSLTFAFPSENSGIPNLIQTLSDPKSKIFISKDKT